MKFIRYFIRSWYDYPMFKAFENYIKDKDPERFEQMAMSDIERGLKPFKNRFDYAFRCAGIYCKHY